MPPEAEEGAWVLYGEGEAEGNAHGVIKGQGWESIAENGEVEESKCRRCRRDKKLTLCLLRIEQGVHHVL